MISNAASVPKADLLRKYRNFGYDFAPEDVITSRATLASAMKTWRVALWGVMGNSALDLTDLRDLQVQMLEDDPLPYTSANGFLLIGSHNWTEARQQLLEEALCANPRPVLVANPDIVAPRESGFSAEPGHFAHRLADRTGLSPCFFGKPFGNIYDLVFDRIGNLDKARVLMVGDSLHTDILGAQSVGIRSELVTRYGFFAGQDAETAIDQAGIVPDFVLDHP